MHLHRKGHALAPSGELLRHMKIEPAILKTVMRIGIPTAVQMVIMSLAEVALLSIVNGFGSSGLAAYGVGNQVLGYVQFPAMSIAIAASILGAQAIGAGHTDRLGLITRTGILLNLAITGSLLLICYVFSRSLIGLFTHDPAVVDIAQDMLHIILWSALLFGCSAVVSGVMRSSGTVLWPTVLSITAIVIVEVPAAWLLSGRFGHRHQRRVVGLPAHVRDDARAAVDVLPPGVAPEEDRTADLTGQVTKSNRRASSTRAPSIAARTGAGGSAFV